MGVLHLRTAHGKRHVHLCVCPLAVSVNQSSSARVPFAVEDVGPRRATWVRGRGLRAAGVDEGRRPVVLAPQALIPVGGMRACPHRGSTHGAGSNVTCVYVGGVYVGITVVCTRRNACMCGSGASEAPSPRGRRSDSLLRSLGLTP